MEALLYRSVPVDSFYNNLSINSNGDWFRLNNARFTVDDIGRREYRLDFKID